PVDPREIDGHRRDRCPLFDACLATRPPELPALPLGGWNCALAADQARQRELQRLSRQRHDRRQLGRSLLSRGGAETALWTQYDSELKCLYYLSRKHEPSPQRSVSLRQHE